MSTSNGGGYCDCGDVEAWTQFPACSIHKMSSQVSNDGGYCDCGALTQFSNYSIHKMSSQVSNDGSYCDCEVVEA